MHSYDDGVAPVVTTMHSNPVTSPQEQPATPIVIMAPQTVTTIISGVPVVTQISATTTHFDVGSSSLGTSSSSPSATIPGDTAIGNTSGTAAAQASLVTSQASSASVASSNDAEAPKTPVGVIVGGAVGGIITVLILIFLFLFCRRRRQLDTEMSSTEPHPGTPWHPVLVPFTAGLEDATRAIDSTTLLIPSRKEREIQEAMPQPESRNMYTPSNSIASNSEALRTHRQSLIIHRIVGLKEAFQATGSSSSGSSGRGGSDMTEILEQNQVMKAEIARLQAQLNFDRALGLTNEPLPGYSRHGDDHLLKQTQGSVAVT
ncbi:hypothetical protein H0H87_003173 [Tephrocybe sp. NHM501043]|nr:hypothetical protein H0H87_003173 [Tephrocybe sp. NHM501043]